MKQSVTVIWTLGVLILSAPLSINAYELGTHARMAQESFNRSVLKADGSYIGQLGIRDVNLQLSEDYKPLVSSGADAGNVFGFTKVRLKLQNTTLSIPNPESPGSPYVRDMSNGSLA